jgi:glycerophosphoryl diester phosphodiesterase
VIAPLARFGAAQVPVRQGWMPLIDSRFVRTAHRARLHVHVWTVNDETTMTRLLDLGVDGIMTDRPTVLKRVLEGRRQWA